MSGKVSPCLLYLTDIELSGSNINISGPPSLQLWTLVLDLCEPGALISLGGSLLFISLVSLQIQKLDWLALHIADPISIHYERVYISSSYKSFF
jgi:hypothetical protein